MERGGKVNSKLISGVLCSAMLVLGSTVAFAESNAKALGVPFIKIETPYGKVREIMLAHGWSPYHGSNASPCDADDERCKGRPEMQTCSDVGLGECSWLWKKGERIIMVKTRDDNLYYEVARYYGN
jgi:hypothetical protein